MFAVLLPIHIIIAVLLIIVVLLQQAKGAGLSPVFGGGQSIFGAKGATPFLSKLTIALAVLFMVTSILLAISPKLSTKQGSIEKELQKELNTTKTAPPAVVPPVEGKGTQIPQGGTDKPNPPQGGK